MNNYQTYIALSRYARWLEDEGRRETWDETVKRYIDFFKHRFNDDFGGIWDSLASSIIQLDVMPSMRCLMTAGPALERDHMAGYNPVLGSTRIVTKEYGNIPIEEAYEKYTKGNTINVLRKHALGIGKWSAAKFTCYGEQELRKVSLKLNSNTIREVLCTPNHRWELNSGHVCSTDELMNYSVGHKIPFISSPKAIPDEDYILGVRHGIVYGDGTATFSCKRVKGYHVRLCGKSSELLGYFEGYPVSYPPSAGGDPVIMMYDGFSKTHELKELPDAETETDAYLLGFMRGWMAADGSVTKGSQVSLCSAKEGLDWLLRYSEKLGFTIQRVYKQSSETNYGKRRQDSYVVYFHRDSCNWTDFLCSWKSDNYTSLHSAWSIVSVENTDTTGTVYCAEVPETNTFALEGGILTGNCSYRAVDSQRAFDEIMYILLCGTGVGFSVERQYVNQLPEIAESFHETDTTIVVSDSKIGWASSYRELVALLYGGKIPRWDLSKIRPAGSRLKTFGGRASGPEPLEELFSFTVKVFQHAKGRKLNSIECHDIVCKVADVVVVGGVRRSALISLSNLTDERMRGAKTGQWWVDNPQRRLANNSVCYTETPDIGIFLKEWLNLYESKSGERGIFNRDSAQKIASRNGRRGIKRVKLTLEDGSVTYLTREEFNAKNIKVGDSI